MLLRMKWLVPCLVALGAFVQGPALRGAAEQAPAAQAAPAARPRPTRPPQFFSVVWKQREKGGEHPATSIAMNNPNLELTLYGAHTTCMSPEEEVRPPCIQISGNNSPNGDPVNLWNGLATGPTAATVKDKNNFVDLSVWGRIRWTTRANGFHSLRPVVKLADGTAWVADRAEANTMDFVTTEFVLSNLRWLRLDLTKVVTMNAAPGVGYYEQFRTLDLSRVDEIGYADMLPGSGHGAGGWSNLGNFEVYGVAVKR